MKTPATTCAASVRRIVAGIVVLAVVFGAATPAPANEDIAGYFRMYYVQQTAGGSYHGPLDFLSEAAAAHADASVLLKAGSSRSVTVDRGHGYLRIDDGSATEQVLTMAVYGKTDGNRLLIVGSSNCADGCNFSVELFAASADRLQPVPRNEVIPEIGARQFIKPGRPVPRELAAISPSIDYLPARMGTTLTLKPWYGYELEEQMSRATRAAIRNVVLDWDAKQGRFVTARGGS